MNDVSTTRRGVRFRLTAWYSGSVLLLLLLSLLALRAWARDTLVQQDREGTARAVELVRSFFRTELAEYRNIDATLFHVSGELIMPDMIVEFVRPDASLFQGPAKPPTADVLALPIAETLMPLDPVTAPGWQVRLRASYRDRVNAQRRIDRGILAAVPITVLLATFVGWLVTGRALRPVAAMAHATGQIAAGLSPSRLPITNPHDEFGQLGRRFNDLLDQRDSTLAQQRRFLADAAHELRTPVARMMSTTELQLGSAVNGADDRATLELVHRDLTGASVLVDELMELARADADGGRVQLSSTYLDDVVGDAIVAWERAAVRRSVSLKIETLEEAPARLDARLVTRLVGVLVSNAISYTPAGGCVTVRVLRGPSGAVLEVQDTGVGIPAGERERIFERFFRGNSARAMEPGGSGLGLAIANGIATSHGARLELVDGTGSGSLFRVTFPPV